MDKYKELIQYTNGEEKQKLNLNLSLKDFSPKIQISTETMIEKFKKNEFKDILYTCDIKQELPIFLSDTGVDSLKPITMMELFESIAEENPTEEALIIEKNDILISITWQQYQKKVKNFAKALITVGIEPFKTVNILGYNSPEWFMAYIGGMYACVPPVGIYPTSSEESCSYIAEHSECGCLVVDSLYNYRKYEKEFKNLKSLKAVVFYGDITEKELRSLTNPFVKVYLWKDFCQLGKKSLVDFEYLNRKEMQHPGNCCNLIYTSGTTGEPKGVMLSHDNLTWTARALKICYGDIVGYKQKLVSFLPLSHIAGQVVDILLTMVTRSKVYFAKPDALSGSLVETLRKVKPTIFFGVPRIFEKFEEKIKFALDSSSVLKKKIIKWAQKIGIQTVNAQFKSQRAPILFNVANFLFFSRVKAALGFEMTRVVGFGAAPLKKSTIEFFKSLNIPLFNNYGMSETTGPQFLNLGVINVDLNSVGETLHGTDVKINNPDRDGVGEIFFRGRNRFMGYFKNEEETIKTIDSDGYIHSGDLGFINQSGHLVITGRIKEIIVTAGGENVAPLPIEENLKDNCKILSNVIIIGDNRPYLTALLTVKSESMGNISEDVIDIIKQIDPTLNLTNVIDVINDETIKKYVQSKIDQINSRAVSRAQLIRKWVFLPQDFTIDSGELTPTHKLKRNIITLKNQKYIQQLYTHYKF